MGGTALPFLVLAGPPIDSYRQPHITATATYIPGWKLSTVVTLRQACMTESE
jgi:hypothetical protein